MRSNPEARIRPSLRSAFIDADQEPDLEGEAHVDWYRYEYGDHAILTRGLSEAVCPIRSHRQHC